MVAVFIQIAVVLVGHLSFKWVYNPALCNWIPLAHNAQVVFPFFTIHNFPYGSASQDRLARSIRRLQQNNIDIKYKKSGHFWSLLL